MTVVMCGLKYFLNILSLSAFSFLLPVFTWNLLVILHSLNLIVFIHWSFCGPAYLRQAVPTEKGRRGEARIKQINHYYYCVFL